jgi:hypothetical protein
MDKEIIKGAILIFSCHKHKIDRLGNKTFGLSKKEYNDWRVFYLIGNPYILSDYLVKDNLITLKCEDSYIHVLKKVVLGIKFVLDNYEIEEGILRCGDDLIFDEKRLLMFLEKKDKNDYMGKIAYFNNDPTKRINYFMPNYYLTHLNELKDPLNGLLNKKIDDLILYHEIPNVSYAGGVVFYLSKKSSQYLVNSLNSIEFDIFKYYKNYGYPFIIEDIGIGFILNTYGIKPYSYNLYSDDKEFNDSNNIAIHTNYLK